MDKKTIFFDIDGTIYDYRKGSPESTIKAINLLKEKGHLPIICTGRSRAMVSDRIMDMGFSGIIAGCGTYIEYNNEVLFEQELIDDDVDKLLEVFKEHQCYPIFEGNQALYIDEEDLPDYLLKLIPYLHKETDGRVKSIRKHRPIASKVTVRPRDMGEFLTAQKLLDDRFDYIYHEADNAAEVIPKGYSKAVGIKHFIDMFGIDKGDTYAFGDSPNDIEMLKFVEYGVAMGNSTQDVLDITKYHTKDMFDDGIYFWLKENGLI